MTCSPKTCPPLSCANPVMGDCCLQCSGKNRIRLPSFVGLALTAAGDNFKLESCKIIPVCVLLNMVIH